jgi:hypothetical protein
MSDKVSAMATPATTVLRIIPTPATSVLDGSAAPSD